jgi:pentatricopeptide repeat protein
MVDMLSHAGRLEKAYEFIKSMLIKPGSTVWGALLCGCRVYRDIKLADIADIYAEAEKWEEVKRLRERIGCGLQKPPWL